MSRVVHFEIPCTEPEKAAAFYTEMFGWTIKKFDGPLNYWLVSTGEGLGIDGGLTERGGTITGTTNTVDVKDIKAAVAKVQELGGRIHGDVMPIPGVGLFIYASDPDGNMFGMMQPQPR